MDNDWDNRTFTDENGDTWLKDENGNALRDERGNLIPPQQIQPTKTTSGWDVFDTSRGHCGLCGSISCRGGCFK